ncbi:hypothetical protein [Streptomyces sp. NPDC012746]|uniref:hypothetical protein n=1 Tax=Streptomyces sp. NPDC012746 TaxID=3364845 RepID=UPI0036B5EC3B
MAKATYHREAMHDRRSVALRMFTAAVVVDFVATKLAMDAAAQFANPRSLVVPLRLLLVWVLFLLVAMVIQVEKRNKYDRVHYKTLELRAAAVLRGDPPANVAEQTEKGRESLARSWATTWPLLAVVGLTAALFWFAGSITEPASDPKTDSTTVKPTPTSTPSPQTSSPQTSSKATKAP